MVTYVFVIFQYKNIAIHTLITPSKSEKISVGTTKKVAQNR